jgi:hypothetical protein
LAWPCSSPQPWCGGVPGGRSFQEEVDTLIPACQVSEVCSDRTRLAIEKYRLRSYRSAQEPAQTKPLTWDEPAIQYFPSEKIEGCHEDDRLGVAKLPQSGHTTYSVRPNGADWGSESCRLPDSPILILWPAARRLLNIVFPINAVAIETLWAPSSCFKGLPLDILC